jgi:hypothetical protein
LFATEGAFENGTYGAEIAEASRLLSHVIHPTVLVSAGTTKRVTSHWMGLVAKSGFDGLVSAPDTAAQEKGRCTRRNARATTPTMSAPFPLRRRHQAASSKIG